MAHYPLMRVVLRMKKPPRNTRRPHDITFSKHQETNEADSADDAPAGYHSGMGATPVPLGTIERGFLVDQAMDTGHEPERPANRHKHGRHHPELKM